MLAWIMVVGMHQSARAQIEGQREPTSIMTVSGPIPVTEIGPVLTHEHLFSIFGAEPSRHPDYDDERLNATVLPALHAVRAQGVRTVVDATAAWFGRDPSRLLRLAEATDLWVVTPTGFYGAAQGRYLPPDVATRSADEIASEWIDEWRYGIEGSGIRPGFIKLGVNAGAMGVVDRKLLAAAARTHLATGLTVAVHTGDNVASAAEQRAILQAEGVSPEAWIWVHAHKVAAVEELVGAAREGGWISLDGWNESTAPQMIDQLLELRKAGVLDRVLLSHDGNLFPFRGEPRPINFLFGAGRKQMTEAGITAEEWNQLTIRNPAKAWAVNVRGAGAAQPKKGQSNDSSAEKRVSPMIHD